MPDSSQPARLAYLDFDLEIGPGQGRVSPWQSCALRPERRER